jgi:hypothetical protein
VKALYLSEEALKRRQRARDRKIQMRKYREQVDQLATTIEHQPIGSDQVVSRTFLISSAEAAELECRRFPPHQLLDPVLAQVPGPGTESSRDGSLDSGSPADRPASQGSGPEECMGAPSLRMLAVEGQR